MLLEEQAAGEVHVSAIIIILENNDGTRIPVDVMPSENVGEL